MKDFQILKKIVASRRSIFPAAFKDEVIEDKVIHELLESANWAPSHKLTEPWRFQVFSGSARYRLSDFMGDTYKKQISPEKFSQIKYDKTRQKPLRSSHIIAICMRRDDGARVPEWEELAAVSCAVMNMWLGCTALELGCYWSSPRNVSEANKFLKLGENEKCLGWFYVGIPKDGVIAESRRGPIMEKTIWHTD